MSLTNKLRELSSLDKSVDVPSLIREAERLEAQNARLRELVREAYCEGFNEGEGRVPMKPFEESQAKAALDKEGSDA